MRLFRIGGAARAETLETEPTSTARSIEDVRREELLDRIRDFFIETKLEVSAGNMQAIHAAFSGLSHRLARKIELMRTEHRTIDQAWLDAAIADDADEDPAQESAQDVMKRLNTGLEKFSAVASQARSATGDYQNALQEHATSLSQVDATGQMIASLADLTRTMIERTRLMEEGMRKSEEEAAALRKSLERAKREAQIDHLTGLPNRRAFEDVYAREYREAQAEIDPLSVAFCDIDHFKRVNDTHGHETGDRVIQAIGQVLQRISSERCHVARHGGEEFVMLFRGMSPREAHKMLDDAREQLAARHFVNRKTDEPIGGITFSGGIADVFAFPDPRTALEAADSALYQAKSSGRNQICLAS